MAAIAGAAGNAPQAKNSTKPAYHFSRRGYLREKSKKERSWLLTVRSGGDYIRPTNEGGAPLATKKFASKSALCEIQESRVSDTREAPEPRAKRAMTLRLWCLFFDN
ncbi:MULTISPECIES: hypothetical protein [unclassified Mesorhizobium]|uniref:hypothetical protein n=1 Tax=unclassified Mesorhizobium TaxID=325217 RepID=UPI001FDFF31E|nr:MULTISPECIES: hypothetical protein [unclassified Mesorhizobium]